MQWRRAKVVETRAKGMSQIEIAHELQVSEASISLDIQYLRNQARESIKEYVTEHLPEQYQVCLCALDTIITLNEVSDFNFSGNRIILPLVTSHLAPCHGHIN